VQEYTPNAFEITIGGSKSFVGPQALEIPITGKYYMGKSLSKAQLSWSIEAEDMTFTAARSTSSAFAMRSTTTA